MEVAPTQAAQEQPSSNDSLLLSRFWPAYRRRTLLYVIATQSIICAAGAAFIYLTTPITLAGWLLIGLFCAAAITLVTIVTLALLRPLKDLYTALVHVSGERSSTTPPNLNNEYYKKTNLCPLLKQIYELAATQPSVEEFETTDDTQQKSSSEALSQLDHTATGIVMLNSDKEIVYANASAPVGTDPNGHKILNLIFDVDMSLEEWLDARGDHDVKAEHAWRRIADKVTGEEGRRLFDVFVSYQKGSEVEAIITLFDRTNEYQPEDDDLDFIAFAAHELRGPITVIRGYLDTLNDGLAHITDSDHKELFQRLIVSANRLSGYVNNILNASRFDRRHLKVHMSEMRLQDIYDTIADDMLMRATAQQRLLSVTLPDDLPTVAADLNSIGEVMANLIDNAIKYSNDGGSIEVTAAAVGDFVEVSVTDYGIGMPANVIQNLFHKFYRSHRSRETVAGTGIGLYISKAIVESNGGKMSVRSVEGHGSTFTFSLPVYASVADKLQSKEVNNQSFIERSSTGWIKNHGAFRG